MHSCQRMVCMTQWHQKLKASANIHVHQPDGEYSAGRDSLTVGRVSEFDHLSYIVWCLDIVAVNKELWLLDACLQQVSVDGLHPGVQT